MQLGFIARLEDYFKRLACKEISVINRRDWYGR